MTDDLSILLATGRARAAEKAVYLRWSPDGGDPGDLGYHEACARIDRMGTQFTTWGLSQGAHVLLASRDDQAIATLFLACLHHGMVAMIVDHQAKPAEVASLLEIRQPEAVIADADLLTTWPVAGIGHRLAIGGTPRQSLVNRLLRRAAAAGVPPAYPDAIDAFSPASPPSAIDPASVAYILFTSGSTARPKGVVIPRSALAAHVRTLITRFGYDGDSRILDILPLHHADGLIQGVFCAWASGGMCVRSGRFSVDAVVRLLIDPLYRDRITHLVAVPTMLALLMRYAADETKAFGEPSFRFVISAAGHLDERLWREFEQRFAVRVCNLYGLTETVVGGCFAGPDDASHVIGSVGKAVDCQVRVVGDDGCMLPVGVAGELQMRGPHLMSGYLADEAATSATFLDGWLRTGDLATIDADGVVRIVGRKKNLVITGGLNIQPEEVAETLRALPGVGDAIAFGIPDPAFTEILVACVVAAEQGTTLDRDALIRGCQERLSGFKVPKAIVQVPALPYGPSGKVQVPRARELFLHAQASGAGDHTGDVHVRVFAVAAQVFHQPVARLSAEDAPGRTPGWDSFAHLAFISGLEAAFKIHLSTADIIAIRSLGDAERVIGEALRG